MPTLPVNDVDLAHDEWGSGDPPLLLVHGFTGSSLDWADVVGPLSADRRVVAYDHRGHGDSTNTGRPESYTFDALTEDLAAFVKARELAPFDLLGHSMGGIVAMKYALANADQLRSLILMDTGAAPANRMPTEIMDAMTASGRKSGMATVAETMVQYIKGVQPDWSEVLEERFRYKITHMDVEAWSAFGAELGTYPSMLDALATLDLPVTVIVGENDTGLRPASDAMAAAIPGAVLVVIPDAAHSPQDENREEWLKAVKAHLARL